MHEAIFANIESVAYYIFASLKVTYISMAKFLTKAEVSERPIILM